MDKPLEYNTQVALTCGLRSIYSAKVRQVTGAHSHVSRTLCSMELSEKEQQFAQARWFGIASQAEGLGGPKEPIVTLVAAG
jgi:hypothetical protein